MKPGWTLLAAAALAGCGAPPCEVPPAGTWTASGTCVGVAQTMTTSFDTDLCTVAFDDWATATGNEPTGGVITGASVVLQGGAFEGCVGDVDPTAIIGTCADGCGFELGTRP